MPNEKEISKLESDELDNVTGGEKKYYLFDGREKFHGKRVAQFKKYPFEVIDENGDVMHRCDSEKTAIEIFRRAYKNEHLEKIKWEDVRWLRRIRRSRQQMLP